MLRVTQPTPWITKRSKKTATALSLSQILRYWLHFEVQVSNSQSNAMCEKQRSCRLYCSFYLLLFAFHQDLLQVIGSLNCPLSLRSHLSDLSVARKMLWFCTIIKVTLPNSVNEWFMDKVVYLQNPFYKIWFDLQYSCNGVSFTRPSLTRSSVKIALLIQHKIKWKNILSLIILLFKLQYLKNKVPVISDPPSYFKCSKWIRKRNRTTLYIVFPVNY